MHQNHWLLSLRGPTSKAPIFKWRGVKQGWKGEGGGAKMIYAPGRQKPSCCHWDGGRLNCCCPVYEMLMGFIINRVNQQEKPNSTDTAGSGHDALPVRLRLMNMLGLTMPPETASTATQTSANSRRSASTQTDQASTSSASSYRFPRYWSTWTRRLRAAEY